MVTFGLGPLIHGQTSIAKLKSAYNLRIIGPRGLQCKTDRKSWDENLLMWSDLALALVSCLFGGYKFASVLRCVGLVYLLIQ